MEKIRSGIWQTDGGSTIRLIVETNKVSGSYETIHGQPEPGQTFPITGFVNDELIGFVTSWDKYKSMTSWCGRYGVENGRECIYTVWHLGRMFADPAHQVSNDFWCSFITFTGYYYWVRELTAEEIKSEKIA